MTHDPYAAPTARVLGHTRSGRMRIEGRSLVAPLGASLPPICVLTGEPQSVAGSRHSKMLTWVPSWVTALIFVNLIVALIVQSYLKQTTMVSYSMEPALHRERARRKWIAAGVFVGGIMLMFAAAPTKFGGFIAIGGTTAMVGMVLFIWWARGIYAYRMEGAYVHIRGINPAAMAAIVQAADEQEASEPDWRAQMFPGRA